MASTNPSLDKPTAQAKAKAGPHMPRASLVKALNHMWIDTNFHHLPDNITYELYPQPSRGFGAQGSYLVRFPPGYDAETTERYPVLYWLHGGMSNQTQALGALEFYGAKMDDGAMPKTIVVAVQALPVGWYANSRDGSRPIATICASDLVSAVDARYRTVRHASARWIEGFSMGGYGTLHLGFSYPQVFGVLSSIAGALLPRLDQEPAERVDDTFFKSQEYYDQCHPSNLLVANRARLGATVVRLLSGADDGRLTDAIARMATVMDQVGMRHRAVEVQDVDHDYEAILHGCGEYATSFWAEARGRVVVE